MVDLSRFSLEGKVAIVTGCERGLGYGIATGLAGAGADIFGVSSSGVFVNIQAAVERYDRHFFGMKADLMCAGTVDGIVGRCVQELGQVDILVNNAGIIRREDTLTFSEKDWDDVMNINLKTVFFLCQRVVKQFIQQGGGGKIINIASMLSYQGGIRVPSYTASKSGVMGITRLMANEWAGHGINVNAIAPGYMATDNTQEIRSDEQRSDEILARIPANRWGTPGDMAGAAVFLCSEAAAYVNGFTLAVDGGWLAR